MTRFAPALLVAVVACKSAAAPAPAEDAGETDASQAPVAVAAPRPVGPVSVSFVTSRRPVFRWKLADGSDGARVEVCADRNCTTGAAHFDAAGDHGSPSDDLPPGVLFWRLRGTSGGAVGEATSDTWEVVVPRQSGSVATAWGAMLDGNGDGFGDVAVGDSDVFAPSQYVFVHAGGPAGPSPAATATLSAPAPIAAFAASIASAGDVDGDGFADLVAGSPKEDTVYLWRGSSAGLGPGATAILGEHASHFGASVSGAGDVDGDGYADVVVGAPVRSDDGGSQVQGAAFVLFGGSDGLSAARMTELRPNVESDARGFGSYVSTAGDVDGDGLADVAVWVGTESTNPQAVALYLGKDKPFGARPSVRLRFDGSDTYWLGNANLLACAGDVNGDGYSDVAIATAVPPNGIGADHVSLFLGSASGPPVVPSLRIATPLGPNEHFALSLAAIDADGDAYGDLGVATTSNKGTSAIVVSGAGVGLGGSVTISAPDVSTTFEREVGSSGDLDGDGYADLVVGYPTRHTTIGDADVRFGAVEVHAGGPGGVDAKAKWTLLPPAGAVAFGASLVRP